LWEVACQAPGGGAARRHAPRGVELRRLQQPQARQLRRGARGLREGAHPQARLRRCDRVSGRGLSRAQSHLRHAAGLPRSLRVQSRSGREAPHRHEELAGGPAGESLHRCDRPRRARQVDPGARADRRPDRRTDSPGRRGQLALREVPRGAAWLLSAVQATGRPVAIGALGEALPHNALALVNVAYNISFGWTKRTVRSLEAQMLEPLLNQHPVEIGLAGREAALSAALSADPAYAAAFAAAYPGDAAPVSFEHIVKAIASFER